MHTFEFVNLFPMKIISGMNLMSTIVISHHIIMSIVMYIRGLEL